MSLYKQYSIRDMAKTKYPICPVYFEPEVLKQQEAYKKGASEFVDVCKDEAAIILNDLVFKMNKRLQELGDDTGFDPVPVLNELYNRLNALKG